VRTEAKTTDNNLVKLIIWIGILFLVFVLILAGGLVAWDVFFHIMKLPLEQAILALVAGAALMGAIVVVGGIIIYRHHTSN
jgi:uncharacterized integral membrane protein